MSGSVLFQYPKATRIQSSGIPYALAKLYFYETGTTTLQPVWTDEARSIQFSQPIQSDATGQFPPIYLDPTLVYKTTLTTVADVLIDTVDPAYDGALTAEDIGSILYPRTAAEAGVSPLNFSYQSGPIIDARRFGFIGDGVTNNDAAWAAANAVLTVSGGTLKFAPGTYVATIAQSMPNNSNYEGSGQNNTVLKWTSNVVGITIPSSAARCSIRSLTLQGTAKAGTAIQLGDSSFTGVIRIQEVYIQGWALGIRFAGALWTVIENCYIQLNTRGVDFNAGSASNFNAAVSFNHTVIHLNDNEGVRASYVPVNNVNLSWRDCSIQNNCSADVTKPQFSLAGASGGGFARGVVIDGCYTEYKQGGTPPDFMDIAGLVAARITGTYIDTCAFAFKDRIGGSCANVRISHSNCIGNTQEFIHAVSETDFVESGNNFTGTITLTGTGARSLSGFGSASWPALNVSWTPTIRGSGTAGTPTYTLQSGFYSKVGNVVTFMCRITTSTKTGIAGNISVEGLPVAAITGTAATHIFGMEASGITVSGGNTQIYAELLQNTTSILLMQQGSTTPVQLTDAALAAATTVIISGSYQANS